VVISFYDTGPWLGINKDKPLSGSLKHIF